MRKARKILFLSFISLIIGVILVSCVEKTPEHSHNYSIKVIEPNCEEDGYTIYTCICGDVYKDDYVKASHKEVIDEGVEATCQKNGLTEGKHCSVCGEILISQEEVEMLPACVYVDGKCIYCFETECNCKLEYKLLDDGTYEVTGIYERRDYRVVIPREYNGCAVTRIGDNAFYHGEIKSVSISNTVTHIGKEAFYGCDLTYVKIPEGVLYIEDYAFCNSDVRSVTIPKSVKEIGFKAFYDVGDLFYDTKFYYNGTRADWDKIEKSSVIGFDVTQLIFLGVECEHVEVIDEAVKPTCTETGLTQGSHCSKCNEVIIEQEVIPAQCDYINGVCKNCGSKEILLEYELLADGTYEVVGCTELKDTNIIIPDQYKGIPVTSIGTNAFANSGLTSVTLKEGIKTIRSKAFYECENLTTINFPEGITNIDPDAFYECKSLNSITFPKTLKYIGENAFRGCTNLETVIFQEDGQLTSIGDGAFYYCYFESLFIPKSVNYIGFYAFSYVIPLKTIVVDEENEVYDSRDNCNAIIETETNTLYWGCQSTTIPSTVTVIGDSAFYRCYRLTEITIPNSVIKIGHAAFWNCYKITEIVIPESVISIGSEAFYHGGLVKIVISKSVKEIDYSAFDENYNLSKVYYKGTVDDWSRISIDVKNTPLTSADIYYFSETKPTTEGKYWYYNTDEKTPKEW